MSFDLTVEQRAFRDMMKSFVDSRIAPNAAEYDREQTYPWKNFEAAREIELPALGVPEEYGGGGSDDYRFLAVVSEVLARAGASGIGFPRFAARIARPFTFDVLPWSVAMPFVV